MKYDAVLFDLDGTLIDSADDLGSALNHVLKVHGLPAISPKQYRTQASNGSLALLKLGFDPLWHTLNTQKIEQLKQEFLAFYADHLWVKSDFYAGILHVIEYLDHNQIPWSIVTNKPKDLTEPLIAQIREFNGCHNIISGDTLERAKPHPDPLLHSCDLMKVEPSRCLYVGDDERDIIAGHSAGMKTAVALWGYLNGRDVNSWDGDVLLDNPCALLNHISS